jgi:hypothetical protein
MLMLSGATGKNAHLIRDEIIRWRKILEVPYEKYSLPK